MAQYQLDIHRPNSKMPYDCQSTTESDDFQAKVWASQIMLAKPDGHTGRLYCGDRVVATFD